MEAKYILRCSTPTNSPSCWPTGQTVHGFLQVLIQMWRFAEERTFRTAPSQRKPTILRFPQWREKTGRTVSGSQQGRSRHPLGFYGLFLLATTDELEFMCIRENVKWLTLCRILGNVNGERTIFRRRRNLRILYEGSGRDLVQLCTDLVDGLFYSFETSCHLLCKD
jgi:membrane glycosyltransferase